ncbi:thioredoxin domain-containing protein [Candidatus Pacearchaeota archaeon]|nr:thioredoxin domain-containing protein [Candidatus Pacearchaeota archaeon]
MPTQKEEKSDMIEIPIGAFFKPFKQNPWMPTTLLLGIVTIILLIVLASGGVTGNVVSEDEATANLLAFINAQGQGNAEIVSVAQENGLYKMTIAFQGQQIPVYVTLDGSFLVTDPIPLTGGSASTGASGPDTSQRVEVEIGSSPVKGLRTAPVTIVEFTDYQCPFCGKHHSETYPQIIQEYVDTGKVLYVLKDYPLEFHPEAQKAAEAARCAQEQKGDAGYFKMHDKLFENQDSLSIENYKKWAREIGVPGVKFDECLDSGKYADEVQADLAYGQQLGVTGTPAFFIDGISVEGAQPYSVFKQVIDAELAGAQA